MTSTIHMYIIYTYMRFISVHHCIYELTHGPCTSSKMSTGKYLFDQVKSQRSAMNNPIWTAFLMDDGQTSILHKHVPKRQEVTTAMR